MRLLHRHERAKAVEELAEAWGRRLYAFCLRLAGNRSDADDLYQQTFLRVLDMPGGIDPERNPAGLLMAVAVRLRRDDQAKKARRHRIAPLSPEPEQLELASDGILTEQLVEQSLMKRQVQDAVQNLPEGLRTPVLLFYMGGLSVREAADALGLPEGTLKSRLHQARQQLKGLLEEGSK